MNKKFLCVQHRYDDAMSEHAIDAIPGVKSDPLPITKIYSRQQKPRLPIHEVRELIISCIDDGLIEVVQGTYQQGAKVCFRFRFAEL